MKPEDLQAIAGSGAPIGESFDVTTLDLPAERWADVAVGLRDDPRSRCDFFDWLSAYDDNSHGLAIVVRVWSTEHRAGVLLRTHVQRDAGHLASLTPVWAGANWHERETFEMFGVSFDGHPNLVPLLLPDGFEGHPLRKDFVLASRVAKDWPGAKEPGNATQRSRRPLRPPGVPEPGEWGQS